MGYKYFTYESGDKIKLLRKDEGLVLKTGKMPISHGVVECDLELELVKRKNQKHFVASVKFPAYTSCSIELSPNNYQRGYNVLKNRIEKGKYKVVVNLEGRLDLQFENPSSNIKSFLKKLRKNVSQK